MAMPARSPSKNAANTTRPTKRPLMLQPRSSGGPGSASRRRAAQLIVKLLLTVNGAPENAGTRAPRNLLATHAPVGVPSKGAPLTVADCAAPFVANVTMTRPVPDASPRLQA